MARSAAGSRRRRTSSGTCGPFRAAEDVARAVVLLCSATPASSRGRRWCDGGTRPTGRAPGATRGGQARAMPELFGRATRRRARRGASGGSSRSPGVRLVTLGDGVERGVRVLEFRTGTGFEFDVLVDRAFDIGRCEHSGRPLAWLSAVGFAGPWFYEPEGLGLLPHLRRRPADDLRARPRAVHGRGHGRAVPLPAEADRDVRPARPRLEPPGAPRRLRRTLGRRRVRRSTPRARCCRRPSSASSCPPPPHRGARRRVAAPRSTTRSRTSATTGRRTCSSTTSTPASRSSTRAPSCSCRRPTSTLAATIPLEGYRTLTAPAPGYVEQVFEHELAAEPDGHRPRGASSTAASGWGSTRSFAATSFLTTSSGGCSARARTSSASSRARTATAGRLDARERGELIELAPARSRRYDLELGALDGGDEIDAFADAYAQAVE